MRRPFTLAMTVALAGCSTTLSTLNTGRPVEVGKYRATGGVGLYLPLGPAARIVDTGIRQAQKIEEATRSGEPYALSDEDREALVTAGVALAVMPPAQVFEVGVRTGIFKDADAGVRYSVNAVRADARYGVLHLPQGPDPAKPLRTWDVSVGLGASYYLFDNPVLDVIEFVQLGDFSRWDLEVPLIASVDFGDILKLYAGLKYLYSRTSLEGRLVNYSQQATNVTGLDVTLPERVDMHFFGGVGGLAVGYRWAYLLMELNGGYTHANPLILGRRRQLGGATFYPALGLMLTVP
jgi:hypothetical protein